MRDGYFWFDNMSVFPSVYWKSKSEIKYMEGVYSGTLRYNYSYELYKGNTQYI